MRRSSRQPLALLRLGRVTRQRTPSPSPPWPLCRVPDGRGRDLEKPTRRHSAAHRGSADAASHINGMRCSAPCVRQNSQETCALICRRFDALGDLASARLGDVRRRTGGGAGLPQIRNGRTLGVDRSQSGGCALNSFRQRSWKGVCMSSFNNRPLVRDVDDARRINVATPRTLRISVSDARQLVPTLSSGGNTLFICSGYIRFGQDNDSEGEDKRNEESLYSELDGEGNNSPRTVLLQLRGPVLSDSQFIGGGASVALADVYLTTTNTFGAATNNGAVVLTQPVEDDNQLAHDLWVLSDVEAERSSDSTSQINRIAYGAAILLAL